MNISSLIYNMEMYFPYYEMNISSLIYNMEMYFPYYDINIFSLKILVTDRIIYNIFYGFMTDSSNCLCVIKTLSLLLYNNNFRSFITVS